MADSEDSFNTEMIQGWVQRIQAGDREARNELLRRTSNRLERLARKMLRRFPGVRDWEQTGDVLQNAMLRLVRALETLSVTSTREFFGLAATQMRRELIDLARRYYGPHGEGFNRAPAQPDEVIDRPARTESAEELERWCRFHQEVDKLPVLEREVVSLIFYHGWTRVEVAEMFQINERTVRRRWESALAKLHDILKETDD
jgi:RNA polymerase sigma-70 factor (ECF subfamily)